LEISNFDAIKSLLPRHVQSDLAACAVRVQRASRTLFAIVSVPRGTSSLYFSTDFLIIYPRKMIVANGQKTGGLFGCRGNNPAQSRKFVSLCWPEQFARGDGGDGEGALQCAVRVARLARCAGRGREEQRGPAVRWTGVFSHNSRAAPPSALPDWCPAH